MFEIGIAMIVLGIIGVVVSLVLIARGNKAPAYNTNNSANKDINGSNNNRPRSCPNCGEPIKSDTLFCVNCGYKLY